MISIRLCGFLGFAPNMGGGTFGRVKIAKLSQARGYLRSAISRRRQLDWQLGAAADARI